MNDPMFPIYLFVAFMIGLSFGILFGTWPSQSREERRIKRLRWSIEEHQLKIELLKLEGREEELK